MDMTKVKILNKSNNPMPEYKTSGSAGMDLRAYLSTPVYIDPMDRYTVKTGLYIELPEGYEAQVRSRSGLSISAGLIVLNAPGTIDSDYRGEVCVILMNLGEKPVCVKNGDRIAQLVICPVARAEIEAVDTLNSTERGAGGFGHTGIK